MAITVGRSPCTEAEAIRRGFGGRDCARRRQVMVETLRVLLTASPPDHFHQLARDNHARWAANAEPSPDTVDVQVFAGDWGEVTLDLSRRYGKIFAALNMATAFIPGGGYIEGASLQEENLYRRSDYHLYIRDDDYDREADRYRPHMTELISGTSGRVYLDTNHPRVCSAARKTPVSPAWAPAGWKKTRSFPFTNCDQQRRICAMASCSTLPRPAARSQPRSTP